MYTCNLIDAVDGPPSSPFVSEIDLTVSTSYGPRTPDEQDSAQTRQSGKSASPPSNEPSTAQKYTNLFAIHEDEALSDQKSLETQSQETLSPSKQIISELAAKPLGSSPRDEQTLQHQLLEDKNVTGNHTPKRTNKFSPQKRAGPSRIQSPTKASPLRYNEGLTVATKSWTQIENSNQTAAVEGEEQGIDDTCFSAFSEVPAELTKNLQRSARKGHFDPVSFATLFASNTTKRSEAR